MRQIKFRGKNGANGKWIYGDSIKHTDNPISGGIGDITYIGNKVPNARKCGAMKWMPVVPDTVGQFSGLLDKNGKEIYEGDIFTVNGNYPKLIEFRQDQAAFCMANIDELNKPYLYPWQRIRPDWWNDYGREIEVIGNIHDNPSLISDKQR